jgi:glutamyl endopeptidase
MEEPMTAKSPLYGNLKLAAATLGFALLATSAATAAEMIVSSDGTVEAAKNYAARSVFSPAYDGTGELSRATVDTADEYARLSKYRGISLGGRSVIGADGRTRVTGTTSSPYRKIALITFGGGYICTGWLVNANTVVTAGHCVYDTDTHAWYSRTSYRIYPGRNASTSPYGSCTAKALYSNSNWTSTGSPNYDFGAIKLNCTVGNTTGWFGYWWQSASLVGKAATVTGYPGDKAFGTMWKMSGSIGRNTTRQVSYTIDTYGGQSGSPVYQNKSGCGWCSMAIHAYGASGSPLMNSGTRITQSVYNFIGNVKAKP